MTAFLKWALAVLRAIGLRGALAMFLAVVCVSLALDSRKLEADLANERTKVAERDGRITATNLAHSITTGSLIALKADMARLIEASATAQISAQAAIEAQRGQSAAMTAQARALRDMAAAAPPQGADDCATPEELTKMGRF